MRKLVRRALRGAGHGKATIHEAGDGVEALAALEEQEVDLILSDVNMPNMTGLELLEQLQEQGKKYPIVMITTEADTDISSELREKGAGACIGKPFSPDQLGDAISAVMG